MSEENKYPEAVVGALIVNQENKIFLATGNKWDGKYVVPGGHVRFGEKMDEAIIREMKEEVGINVEIEDKLGFSEAIKLKNAKIFSDKHLIFLDYICRYKGSPEDIKLNDEHSGYGWFTIEEAKKLDLVGGTRSFIEKYEKYLEEKDALNGWKRCQADFENYKKDQAKMMVEFRKFASLDTILQILPVLDNFNASLEHVPADQKDNAWVTGINYIQKQLEDILKNNGIEEIEVKEGDEFDPEIHEAVADAGSEGPVKSSEAGSPEAKFNRVKKIIQKGYKINGKVIRAARVIVE
jgi:nucleoside triphosphatase